MIELRDRVNEPAVAALVALSHFSASGTERALEHYRKGSWRLLGKGLDSQVVGCVGFEHIGRGEIVIRSLAVEPGHRGRGLGRELIEHVAASFSSSTLVAETDRDAVGFYRRCGFRIESIERFRGVERFRCVREPAGTASGGARAGPGP